MHVRRSVLAFFVGGAVLFSLSLTLWSRVGSTLPWPSGWTAEEQGVRVVDDPQDLDHNLPDPVPGEDDLRKNPSPPKGEEDLPEHVSGRIRVFSPLLQTRLQVLMDAPVQSHAAALAQNEKACPRKYADKQVNQDQLRDNLENWKSIGESEIRDRRAAIVQYLEKLQRKGEVIMGDNEGSGEGRGIVMTAGNKDTAHTALVTLRILRLEYRSNLPVQIFSFPGELTDENIINEYRDLDATHHEVSGLEKIADAWKNFHLKAASIISSRFAEVLYIDSDNIPLRDPAYLFDEAIYKNNGGAVFWPDYNKDHPDNAIWRVLGKTCDYTQWEVESGQILIDKRGNSGLNLAALHIAAHMQAEHAFWFSLSGGDKDTFRYAFWALGAQYLTAPRWLSALGTSYGRDAVWQQGKFCGLVMLQYDIVKDERGQRLPLFVHANLLKHRNAAASKNRQYFQTIKRARDDEVGDESLSRIRMWVYQDGGMCVDLEIDEPGDGQEIITEQFSEIYEGKFKDFEVQFFRQKGKVGGW